ncbi:Uncharacterised protein [Bordetella pertussis]|nr:Uncharacterised protein [Bordetella pertussis]CFW33338.1 Uncharacterised protein [Bordetella pertussis]
MPVKTSRDSITWPSSLGSRRMRSWVLRRWFWRPVLGLGK